MKIKVLANDARSERRIDDTSEDLIFTGTFCERKVFSEDAKGRLNESNLNNRESINFSVALTDSEIDSNVLLARATRPSCGAVLLFLGTTRQWTNDEETDFLFYEAYHEMAINQLNNVASEAVTTWGLEWVEIVHRLGRVDVASASVAVVVASPHRTEAFAAGEWIMNRLKECVPIWKQDHSPDSKKTEWKHPL